MKSTRTKKREIVEWYSLTMGNIVDTFGEVVKQIWDSLINHHILDLKWERTKKEFEPPIAIWIAPRYISDEWFLLDKWGKEWAISCYLVDEYDLTHKGFEYEETDEAVIITNIIWDEEE